MQSKFTKFMIALAGIFATGAGVMGIKLKDDAKKVSDLRQALGDYNSSMNGILETQREIVTQRQELLDRIANAPAPDTTKAVTTQTVVPGKVVQKKVPVSSSSSSGSSSKTTKSS